VTNVPSGLSNVVAVATGGDAALALQANGTLVAWGLSSLTNIPVGVAGVKAISAGFEHNLLIESGMFNPVIFVQPTNQYAVATSNVTFYSQGEASGIPGVSFQWLFNSNAIAGATNANLTLSSVNGTDNGSYQVVVYSDAGSITSAPATFTLVTAPAIAGTSPVTTSTTNTTWVNLASEILTVAAGPTDPGYPLSFGWQLNGTNLGVDLASDVITNMVPGNEGFYTVNITNKAGTTNITWNIRLALPGMVEGWGSDGSHESDRPVTLTNATGIAAGEYQSVAVTDAGSVVQWGQYSNSTTAYSVTNTTVATLPPTSGVVAVAAGLQQGLALMINGTVYPWGLTSTYGVNLATNQYLTGVSAVACGWTFDLALLTNGTVKAWGDNTYGQTNIPSNLTNVIAIAAGANNAMALQSNGTIVIWGDSPLGNPTPPSTLTNPVAIASGESHWLALQSNGCVVAWGDNTYKQINVPAAASNNVMAIAAGDNHSVALLNNGTLVEWGNDSSGQTNTPALQTTAEQLEYPTEPPIANPPIVVKFIAAAGNHTVASIFSPLVQYPINVANDLLLVYNTTNTSYSSNICAYYLANRPMVANANVIGLQCSTAESIGLTSYQASFSGPISNWLSIHPTKRPLYVILFQDLPTRLWLNDLSNETSVQYDIHCGINTNLGTTNYSNYFPAWTPFVTSINMDNPGQSNNCYNYINKLTNISKTYSPGQLIISAKAGGYLNANWCFDDDNPQNYTAFFTNAVIAVTNINPSASIIYTNGTGGTSASHITNAAAVAAFGSWGVHGYNGGYVGTNNYPYGTNWGYATNGTIVFSGASAWYLIETGESFNGQQIPIVGPSTNETETANFISWYEPNAFGGASGSQTPVGAVSNVDEPDVPGLNLPAIYFGDWESGRILAYCAWNSFPWYTPYPQVVGDPFTKQ
jgi:alpha-tubulin suppressor-like RCC1 family protein